MFLSSIIAIFFTYISSLEKFSLLLPILGLKSKPDNSNDQVTCVSISVSRSFASWDYLS